MDVKSNITSTVDIKKLLYLMGILIFGGMFTSSIIDRSIYTSTELLEFRLFILGSASLFFILVFTYHRIKK